MMYFTSEIYEKTQIRGRFPLSTDNKEKWMSQLDKFYNGGHNNDTILDALLFKYIPEVKEDILCNIYYFSCINSFELKSYII